MKKIIAIKAWKIVALITLVPALIIILGAILVSLTQATYWTMVAALTAALLMCTVYYGWIWQAYQYLKDSTHPDRLNFNLFNFLLIASILLAFILLP